MSMKANPMFSDDISQWKHMQTELNRTKNRALRNSLPDRYVLNQFKTEPERPTQFCNLSIKTSWSAVSNAALRSNVLKPRGARQLE